MSFNQKNPSSIYLYGCEFLSIKLIIEGKDFNSVEKEIKTLKLTKTLINDEFYLLW